MAERDFLEKEIKYDPTSINITQNSFQNATEVFVSLQHETLTFSIQRIREVPFIGVESGTKLFLTLSPFLK